MFELAKYVIDFNIENGNTSVYLNIFMSLDLKQINSYIVARELCLAGDIDYFSRMWG